jgi:hypothetical protein
MILLNTPPQDFGVGTFIVVGIGVALSIVLVRQAIFHSAIQRVEVSQQGEAILGAPVSFNIDIGLIRDIAITEATLTISAEERATSGEGKSSTTYRHICFSQAATLEQHAEWKAGMVENFTPEITIPAIAPPSFSGSANRVTWTAFLWVGIPGWYPDIRKRITFTVPAQRAVTKVRDIHEIEYRLSAMADFPVHLTLECPIDRQSRPVIAVGDRVPFTLRMEPRTAAKNEQVSIELAYRIAGQGNSEQATLARLNCFRNGWQTGALIEETGFLYLPPHAPVTYTGHVLSTHWTLTVRRKVPWALSAEQVMEIIVIPKEIAG